MARKDSYQNIGELYVPIVFRWEGGGREVCICTSFTGWEANKIPMARSQRIGYSHSTATDTSHDEFTVVVELPEGVHEYKYFVDGEWNHDPNAEAAENAFGTLNNIRRVTKEDFKSSQQLRSTPPEAIPEHPVVPLTSPPLSTQPPPSKPVSTQPPPSKPVSKEPPPSKPVSKEPPPSKPVSTQPPPSKPVSKEPPPSKPVSTQPPPSKPVSKEPPPSKAVSKQPPPSKPVSKEPPPSKPVSKQPPPSKPVSKQPPPSKPVSKQPPPSKPVSKQPPPSKPVSTQPPPSKPVSKQPPPSKPVSTQPPPSKPVSKQTLPSKPAPPTQPVVKVSVGTTAIAEELGHGTITPAANFNPEADATALRMATKKHGADGDVIISILAHRSKDQRQEISTVFKDKYRKDLISEFKSVLTFNFKNTVLALMVPKTLYDAQCLHKAISGNDESCLVEILCSRTNAEIRAIKQVYKSEFSKYLEKDVADHTSGHFKRLMVSLCQGAREESTRVDMAKAQREAQELYQAGERKWGTDEANFIPIVTLRSFPQLRATFDKYAEIAKRDILDSIKHDMSGDLRTGMKAIVRCARSRHQFFADLLYKIMKGAGTNDASLIRIIVSRSEVDLVEIKAVFLETHKKTLSKAIEGDTSGDYRKLLLAIVGNHD